MTQTNEEPNETPKKKRGRKDAEPDTTQPSFAADLIAAVTDAETSEPEWAWEVSEEVIDVKITDADCRAMIQANGADEEAKSEADREIDTLKADLKEKKAESEAIAARLKDRNRQGSKETWPKKAHWKVGTCFSLNTIVYIDPDTGVEVSRRSLTQRERQLELGVDAALDLIKPTDDPLTQDETSLTDPEALLRAAQAGEDSDESDEDDALDDDGENDQ